MRFDLVLLFWTVFTSFYIWHAFGVTIGLHRLLSHRSFKCNKFVEYFIVLGAYIAFQHSPIWWVAMHRAHHKYSETPLDPHTPKGGLAKAFTFYSHFDEWRAYPKHISPANQCPDLLKDPIYNWLERAENLSWWGHFRTSAIVCVGLRLVLWAVFGPTVAAASMLAAITAYCVALGFNILSHIPSLGYKSYETTDDTVNVWWLAVISMGDAWHNNHHAFPNSARAGILPHEIDISWQVIKLLRTLKLASKLNEPKTAIKPKTTVNPEPQPALELVVPPTKSLLSN